MPNFYCKHCGLKFTNLPSLTNGFCNRNPGGRKHELYEGSEKSEYYCKHCGLKFTNLPSLVNGFCNRNPYGRKHEPAL